MKKKIACSVATIFTIIVTILSLEIRLFAVSEQDKQDLQDKIDEATQQLDDIAGNKDTAQSELEELTIRVSEALTPSSFILVPQIVSSRHI